MSITVLPLRFAAPARESASRAAVPFYGEDQDFAELGCLSKGASRGAGVPGVPFRQLLGGSRADHYFMAMLNEAGGERFRHSS